MNQDFSKTLHHYLGQESLHKGEATALQQREWQKQLSASSRRAALNYSELRLSCEVSSELCRKRSFQQPAFFCGAPSQDLQLQQTITLQGQSVIKVGECKLEELARKWKMRWEMSFFKLIHTKMMWYLRNTIKMSCSNSQSWPSNHQHDRGQKGVLLQESSFAMVVIPQGIMVSSTKWKLLIHEDTGSFFLWTRGITQR